MLHVRFYYDDQINRFIYNESINDDISSWTPLYTTSLRVSTCRSIIIYIKLLTIKNLKINWDVNFILPQNYFKIRRFEWFTTSDFDFLGVGISYTFLSSISIAYVFDYMIIVNTEENISISNVFRLFIISILCQPW